MVAFLGRFIEEVLICIILRADEPHHLLASSKSTGKQGIDAQVSVWIIFWKSI